MNKTYTAHIVVGLFLTIMAVGFGIYRFFCNQYAEMVLCIPAFIVGVLELLKAKNSYKKALTEN